MPDIVNRMRVLTTGSSLILDVASPSYRMTALTMPDRTWRRTTAESPDVEGDIELQSVLAAGTLQAEFDIVGTSTADAEAKRNALIAAVETREWNCEVTIDGATRTWRAHRADTATVTEGPYLRAYMRKVSVRIPVQPRDF